MNKKRQLDDRLKNHFSNYKQVLMLLGARQVGKTTLLKRLFPKAVYLLVDDMAVHSLLESYNIDAYLQIIGDAKQIVIDEIHLLSNPGRAVKIIYDQLDDIQIIITGSSALDIKNKMTESLAGRKIEYHLYPLTFNEYVNQLTLKNISSSIMTKVLKNKLEETPRLFNQEALLNTVLTYGLYPDLVGMNNKSVYLKNLADSVVFKDILGLQLIDNREKAEQLLKLLAYQIGNVVNYGNISQRLGMGVKTVEKYIKIFEDSFILYRLYPYFNNKRMEIGKSPKIYFWDLGLRNAVIDNFDPPNIRNDLGALFENFIITEVKKEIEYQQLSYKLNYWRLKSGAEVDLVVSNYKEVFACEVKFATGNITKSFFSHYPKAQPRLITSTNFF